MAPYKKLVTNCFPNHTPEPSSPSTYPIPCCVGSTSSPSKKLTSEPVPSVAMYPFLLPHVAYAAPTKSVSTEMKALTNNWDKALETISRLSGLVQPDPKK